MCIRTARLQGAVRRGPGPGAAPPAASAARRLRQRVPLRFALGRVRRSRVLPLGRAGSPGREPAAAGTARAENELGRRNPFVCMLAALLASAVWSATSRRRPLRCSRTGSTSSSAAACPMLCCSRIARRHGSLGRRRRAPRVRTAGCAACGRAGRRMPRLCIASLSDQVRLHARRFRPETSRALCARIDALLASDSVPRGRLWRRSVEWMQHLAHANAAIAAQEWRRALEALTKRRRWPSRCNWVAFGSK